MKNLQIPEVGEIKQIKRVSLQVPDDINLHKMSDEEIEKLAVELSRKAASSLPKGTSLLGVNGVTLTNMARPNWEIGIFWSRSCSAADFERIPMEINPEYFEPMVLEKGQSDSYRVTLKAPKVESIKPKRSVKNK